MLFILVHKLLTLYAISLRLFIKNMVCTRCKMLVKDELSRLGLAFNAVELGSADLVEDISPEQKQSLREALLRSGLELMDDKKGILIQKIKNIIVELVHYKEEPLTIKLSEYLSQKLNRNYTYLANLFSEVQGITIEKYYITQRIERVKELLVYDELSLTEIARLMNYSNVAHLSTQFKKVTGLTPSHFKGLKVKRRNMLDDL